MPPKKGNSGNSSRGNGGTANNGRDRGGSSGRRKAPADDDDALLDAAIEAAESARAVMIRNQEVRMVPTEGQDSAQWIVQKALSGTEVQWLYNPTGQQRPFLASELTKKAVLADPRLMQSTNIYDGTGIRMVMAQSCEEMVESIRPYIEEGLAKAKTMTGRQELAFELTRTLEVPIRLMYAICSNLQQQQQNPLSQQQPQGMLMVEMEGFSIEQVIGPKAVKKRHVTVAYLTNDAFKALMVKKQEGTTHLMPNPSISAEMVQDLVFTMTESNVIKTCVACRHEEGDPSERYAYSVFAFPYEKTTDWDNTSSRSCAVVGLREYQAMQLEFDGMSLSDIVYYDGNQKGFIHQGYLSENMTFIPCHEKKLR